MADERSSIGAVVSDVLRLNGRMSSDVVGANDGDGDAVRLCASSVRLLTESAAAYIERCTVASLCGRRAVSTDQLLSVIRHSNLHWPYRIAAAVNKRNRIDRRNAPRSKRRKTAAVVTFNEE